MRRFVSTLVLLAMLAGSSAVAIFYQNKGIQSVLQYPPFYDRYNLAGRSGETMKLLALRYDMVAADFLWLRSIQSFGGRGMTNRDWRPLYNLFDTITELDPYFAEAYSFGNLVIGEEGRQQKAGLELLEKGTFKVYRQYRLPFEGMYVAFWQMENQDLARWFGRIANDRADAPDWVSRMVAYVDVAAGQYYIGFDNYIGNLLNGQEEDELVLQEIAAKKAADTINIWNAELLSQAADEYTSQTGQAPPNIEALAAMPALQNYETADMSRMLAGVARVADALNRRGIQEYVLEQFAAPDAGLLAQPLETTGTLEEMEMIDFQDQVFRDSLVTQSGLPASPAGASYMINLARLGNPEFEPQEVFVPLPKLETDALELLHGVRGIIAARKRELGRNPESLSEVFYTDFNTTEPMGGRWIYDAASGEVKLSSRPAF